MTFSCVWAGPSDFFPTNNKCNGRSLLQPNALPPELVQLGGTACSGTSLLRLGHKELLASPEQVPSCAMSLTSSGKNWRPCCERPPHEQLKGDFLWPTSGVGGYEAPSPTSSRELSLPTAT